jgi:UDP-glucose 4-epimerase
MSLEEAMELVIFAFDNANSGDIMVQKAPACTIGDLALSLKELFRADNEIKIIGMRHGEKLYETLLTREEFVLAVDMGNYYRVPADPRNLNYDQYVAIGNPALANSDGYNSNNALRMDLQQIIEKLLSLEYVQNELETWRHV